LAVQASPALRAATLVALGEGVGVGVVSGDLDAGEVLGEDNSAAAFGVGSGKTLESVTAASEMNGGQENVVSARDGVYVPLLK
jgi:hypothetical protein